MNPGIQLHGDPCARLNFGEQSVEFRDRESSFSNPAKLTAVALRLKLPSKLEAAHTVGRERFLGEFPTAVNP